MSLFCCRRWINTVYQPSFDHEIVVMALNLMFFDGAHAIRRLLWELVFLYVEKLMHHVLALVFNLRVLII